MKTAMYVIVLIAGLALVGYHLFSPSAMMKRKTDAALQAFAEAVATHDRAKISAVLNDLITDDAHLRLEVQFFSVQELQGSKPVVQDFDKTSFITFVDNVLFSLTDYTFRPHMADVISMNKDKTAAVNFTSDQWGDGPSTYAGIAVTAHFNADADCNGTLTIEGKNPMIKEMDCKLRLSTSPKSAASGAPNPDELNNMLQH